MIESLNLDYQLWEVKFIEPPFDIKKAVLECAKSGKLIYIHPTLFDKLYEYLLHTDKQYHLDINNPYQPVAMIRIMVTDLLSENEYKVMAPREFEKQYGKNLQ